MPELRRDPIVGRWVIISTERAVRPHELSSGSPRIPASNGNCPFCPGSEQLTPGEILAYRPHGGIPNGGDWTVRVISNKFPALQIEGDLDREGFGLFDRMNGIGAHEVIIETADHNDALSRMAAKRIEDVL